MKERSMQIETTFTPSSAELDFLTGKINESTKALGVKEEAYPFALFMRDDAGKIIAGCNGSVVYGAIYTDQLWVEESLRGQGIGRLLMDKIHELGRSKNCTMATVATMSFQNACSFYEHLGYIVDFERPGYTHNGIMLFLKKSLL